jgi:hypothetical protein
VAAAVVVIVVVVNDMDDSKRITNNNGLPTSYTDSIFVKICPVIITPQTILLAMTCLPVGHNKKTRIKKI